MSVSYNNKFVNPEKEITIKDINAVETKYNFIFPEDFKEHYLTYNGGEPERYVFVDEDEDEYIVTQFIPIKYDEESGRNLEYCLDTLRVGKVLPDWLIPFADETGGDLYCFSLKEGEEGSIYYWSHEYEYGEDPEEHVFYLTNSLKTFIDSMVEDE